MSETKTTACATDEIIYRYLWHLEEKGRCLNTLYSHRRVLRQFCQALPEDRAVSPDSLDIWLDQLRQEGKPEREVQSCRRVAHDFLIFLGVDTAVDPHAPISPLGRAEYQHILQMAKKMGKRRAYLLTKIMVAAGLLREDIQQLTVEILKQGEGWVIRRGQKCLILIPEPLRSELLDYAAEEGIESGLIFLVKGGNPMGHSHIWKEIKQVCRKAGIPEEKSSPKNLNKLYQSTCYDMSKRDVEHLSENYRRFLEEEEKQVFWTKPEN